MAPLPEGTRLALETRKEHRAHLQTDAAIRKYMALAEHHQLDVCQMALAFVNSRPFLTSTLIGATSMEQLRSNIDSINMELPEEVLKEIADIRREYPMPF